MPFGSSRSLRAAAYHPSGEFSTCDEGDSSARELFGSTSLSSREFDTMEPAPGVIRRRDFSSRRGSNYSSAAFNSSGSFEPRVSNTSISPKAASLIRELNNLDFASVGLVGRETELESLHKAYRETMHPAQDDDEKETPLNLLLVGGISGTGKSALVQEFGRQLAQQRTTKKQQGVLLWASGKFEQHAMRPYAAFIPAFVQLVAKIKSHDLVTVKEDIRQAIGKDANLLKDLIPNIHELVSTPEQLQPLEALTEESSCSDFSIGSQWSQFSQFNEGPAAADAYHIVKSQKRFKFLLLRFLTAIGSRHKVVLVLEDVQWIDPASLDLLETILLEPSLNDSILFLCPYRDNQVKDDHPFTRRISTIQTKRNQQASILPIDNMSLESVHEFVTELFNAPNPHDTFELAQIVHAKTNGNAFFLIQFLTALRDHHLLVRNLGTLKWTWDAQEIRASTVVSDNVLLILLEKMKKLPSEYSRILTIGACLGTTLDQVVVDLVVQGLLLLEGESRNGIMRTQEALEAMVQQGLLEALPSNRMGNPSYCFPHDQIQLAARALLLEQKKQETIPKLKLDMGRILYRAARDQDDISQPTFDCDDLLFTTVDFWNEGRHLLMDEEDVQLLIQLNYQAGKKALESSAFEASTQYLRIGLDLIPAESRWTDPHYPLSLELHNTLLKAEYSNGDWGQLQEDMEVILNQRKPPILDKIVAYSTKISTLSMHEHNHPAAIDLAVHVLKQLGVTFRPKMALLGMIGGLLKTKQLLSKKPLESLLHQVELTDGKKLLALEVIGSMQSSLYAASPELFMCTVFKTLRWSFKYGVSKYTAKCIGLYGLVEMAMGNCESATKACRFAEKLAKKQGLMDSEDSPISSVYGFVLPWTTSLHSCSLQVMRGYTAGISCGDLEFAFINMSVYCFFNYSAGKPLSDLEADMRNYGFQMKQYNMTLQLQFLSLTWQTVLNLMGRNDTPLVLSGEVMDEEEMLVAADKDKNPPLRSQVQCHRLQLAVYFGDFELAAKLIGPASNIGAVNPANPIIWRTEFFTGIAAFEMVRRRKRKWKATAKKALSKLKKWVAEGNPNCVHLVLFLQAEELAASGKLKDTEAARVLFNQAIVTSTRSGFRNDSALACERCGSMLESVGEMDSATDYFKKAYEWYSAMHAYGKLDQLNERKALRPALEISALELDGGVKPQLDSPSIGTGDLTAEVSEPFQ